MSSIDAVIDSIWFGCKIRSLKIWVMRLYANVFQATNCEPVLENEVNICLGKLKKLLHYAEDNQVMTQQDTRVAEKTLSKLQEIQKILREKRPCWRRLLDWISQAINLAINLLRLLPPILLILPPSVRISILAILGVTDRIAGLLPSADN
jgi:hypothetical protein